MNKLRTKYRATPPEADEHRPPLEFWGPVRRGSENEPLDLDFRPDEWQPRPEQCPACSYSALSFVANVYGWPIYECRQCDAGFVWPQPRAELLARFYGPRYWSNYVGSGEPLYCRPGAPHGCQRDKECLDRILRGNHQARILDVGAGDGTTLRLLADAGYKNILGIEWDEENARRGKEKLGVPVISADFMNYEEGGWDAILLWAVIEHLKSPLDYLRHAGSLLAPRGRCIVMTGDNASLHARIQGKMDYWIYPPEHLFYFTTGSLAALFTGAGFRNFRWRLQFQPVWKESILWLHRFFRAVGTRLTFGNPFWRSTLSNVLVAWGEKPGR